MKKIILFCVNILLSAIAGILHAQVIPIQHGHAHNDYLHKRPLSEALENGFTSIEIDVYLYHNELKVSHLSGGLDKKQTIEQLYLDPVKKIIEQNGGAVYKGQSTPLILMIDLKTRSAETYLRLKETLIHYKNIITRYKNDSVIYQGAINILISGHKPFAEMLKEDTTMATIDGDISEMNDTAGNRIITRYSSGWDNYFSRSGSGEMTVAEIEKLNVLVSRAHLLHKQIRFYNIPDNPKTWRTLLNAGVDWINTDKLKEFAMFCRQKNSK